MKKSYVLTVNCDDITGMTIESKCDGFNGLELLGLLTWKADDIMKQLCGSVRPDIIKRSVVDKDNTAEEPSHS